MLLSRLIRLATWIVLCALLYSCAVDPSVNRYQLPTRSATSTHSAVAELQDSAFRALDLEDYRRAIDYLQRAIRIEPRDPLSWHYLALTYWRSGDMKRCVEMTERSFSYSDPDDNLDNANRQLREKCHRGQT